MSKKAATKKGRKSPSKGSQGQGWSQAGKKGASQVQRGNSGPTSGVQERGRPSAYSEAIIEKILERLMGGEGLNTICRSEGMPPESTVRQWVKDDREGFSAKYERVRAIGMDAAADKLRELAKSAVGLDAAGVSAIALQVNTEKWYLSKIAPKQYGDKLDVTTNGKDLNSRVMDPEMPGDE